METRGKRWVRQSKSQVEDLLVALRGLQSPNLTNRQRFQQFLLKLVDSKTKKMDVFDDLRTLLVSGVPHRVRRGGSDDQSSAPLERSDSMSISSGRNNEDDEDDDISGLISFVMCGLVNGRLSYMLDQYIQNRGCLFESPFKALLACSMESIVQDARRLFGGDQAADADRWVTLGKPFTDNDTLNTPRYEETITDEAEEEEEASRLSLNEKVTRAIFKYLGMLPVDPLRSTLWRGVFRTVGEMVMVREMYTELPRRLSKLKNPDPFRWLISGMSKPEIEYWGCSDLWANAVGWNRKRAKPFLIDMACTLWRQSSLLDLDDRIKLMFFLPRRACIKFYAGSWSAMKDWVENGHRSEEFDIKCIEFCGALYGATSQRTCDVVDAELVDKVQSKVTQILATYNVNSPPGQYNAMWSLYLFCYTFKLYRTKHWNQEVVDRILPYLEQCGLLLKHFIQQTFAVLSQLKKEGRMPIHTLWVAGLYHSLCTYVARHMRVVNVNVMQTTRLEWDRLVSYAALEDQLTLLDTIVGLAPWENRITFPGVAFWHERDGIGTVFDTLPRAIIHLWRQCRAALPSDKREHHRSKLREQLITIIRLRFPKTCLEKAEEGHLIRFARVLSTIAVDQPLNCWTTPSANAWPKEIQTLVRSAASCITVVRQRAGLQQRVSRENVKIIMEMAFGEPDCYSLLPKSWKRDSASTRSLILLCRALSVVEV